jgi:hypothetical protein
MRSARINLLKPAATLGVLLLLLAGCLAAAALDKSDTPAPSEATSSASNAPASNAPVSVSDMTSDRLVVLSQAGDDLHIRLVQPGRGDPAPTDRPLGFISPDGATVYALDDGRNKTTIRAYDLASGNELRQIVLDGQYFVPDEIATQTLAISRDGRRMLLRRAATDAQLKAWQKSGQPRSEFAVLDTDFTRPPVLFDLAGEFWFDALSRDGRWVYLIEIQDQYPMSYSPEKAPNYQVRAYEVDEGRLRPDPVVDKREVEQMNGYRRASAFSPNGEWLYSMYTRYDEGPFIHALNLSNQAALCIDLPFPASRDFEADLLWSMAVSRDGKMLYAVNGMTGQVAQVHAANGYSVRKTATLALESPATGHGPIGRVLAAIGRWLAPPAQAKTVRVPGALLAPDGRILFATGRTGLLAIETGELTLRGHYLRDLELNSLAAGSDGVLYTVAGTPPKPGRLLMVDPQSGTILREVTGVGQARAVLRAR